MYLLCPISTALTSLFWFNHVPKVVLYTMYIHCLHLAYLSQWQYDYIIGMIYHTYISQYIIYVLSKI